jgi:hypothetical protein
MPDTQALQYELLISAPVNGRVGKANFRFVHQLGDRKGQTAHTDRADVQSDQDRGRLARKAAAKLGVPEGELRHQIEDACNRFLDDAARRQQQADAGSPEAAPHEKVEVLDAQGEELRRPLGLVGGVAYAAAWVQVRVTTARSVDAAGHAVEHNPPLVRVEDRLVVVRGDGTAFADGGSIPGARPLAELGLPVRLSAPPPPGRGWSGAGLKRYLAGERPDPAEVFGRLVAVVDRFIDFGRSLAGQPTMCELVACYVLVTYLLDAFNVVGYLWPNGERGTGKTSLLQVVCETAYLGQLILAGSSYPTLRDLADYGATLAFDDAEAVMDPRRTDPDKRTLLLAGNRRGATVAVKELVGERWETRHVSAFCPRLFSAIRLPDPVLGSRSIVLPLVRSADPARSKANVMDKTLWPCDPRRLVDDCWALALAALPGLPDQDRAAAARARLAGRDLEPWRAVLAVAHWLQQEHGLAGLFDRTEKLSVNYQDERSDQEETDATRVLFRALLELTEGHSAAVEAAPAEIAEAMNRIAREEDLGPADKDKDFTNSRKVGWIMKRQRFSRGERSDKSKAWKLVPGEVEAAARAYGVQRPTTAPPEGEGQAEIATPF